MPLRIDPDDSRATLELVGFVAAGAWQLAPAGGNLNWQEFDGKAPLLDAKNALYAFCEGAVVRYIGKTTRSIRRRFRGYRTPGVTQVTNLRCHGKIRDILGKGGAVEILVLADLHQLQWSFLKVNLAAGLEDSLIAHFEPAWNATKGGKLQSETAEHEEADDAASALPDHGEPETVPVPKGAFGIKLGKTYYTHGYINAGVEASTMLGGHDELASIYLGSLDAVVTSRINRTANANGSVRFVGNNAQVADWFRAHFHEGDVVTAEVLDRHRILLRDGAPAMPPLA